jgi:hypothetical protein
MTVEPREVEVHILQPTCEDPLEARCSHPDLWSTIDSLRCEEAMRDIPTSTRAGRKARRKARQAWKRYQPYVHLVSSTIPGIMHACRESRNMGLYQQFSMDVDEQDSTDRHYIWINMDIDVMDIGDTHMAYFKPIAHLIKRLKFNRMIINENWYDTESALLQIFTNVEEIQILCGDSFYNWGDEVDSFVWPCPLENLVFIDEESPGGPYRVGHREMERIRWRLMGNGNLSDEE